MPTVGMVFPRVEIAPNESVFKADEKVEQAFEAAGYQLLALDGLNSFLEGSHFFQVPLEGGGHGVVVVATRPWEEKHLIEVLNVLLSLRLDPDPPGSDVPFEFYSAHAVPDVLRSVFGSSPSCHFECRSLLVARFGNDLGPDLCTQLAALGAYLLREVFDVSTGFFDPAGPARIGEVLDRHFIGDPECVEPINSLLVLGSLLGEMARSRISLTSQWIPRGAESSSERWPTVRIASARAGVPDVSFAPIDLLIRAYQAGDGASVAGAAAEVLDRCAGLQGG